jgi:hypothetical protein
MLIVARMVKACAYSCGTCSPDGCTAEPLATCGVDGAERDGWLDRGRNAGRLSFRGRCDALLFVPLHELFHGAANQPANTAICEHAVWLAADLLEGLDSLGLYADCG